jgi:ABC-type antimicrobial peptide transport system permease subunit
VRAWPSEQAVRTFCAFIVIGGALGAAAATGVTQFLKNLLFNIGPHSPATFAGVAQLLALVALVVTLIPARAARRVDPIVALRYK